MPELSPPAIIIAVPDRDSAQRQFWRHVANRACLSILADNRCPFWTPPQHSADPTRPPQHAPRTPPGGDLFEVRVDTIQLTLGASPPILTTPLTLLMLVALTGEGNRLTLAALRDWPAPKTAEPLFRYWDTRRQLVRRDGLSGDVVYLFEMLLAPHAAELLNAMGI